MAKGRRLSHVATELILFQYVYLNSPSPTLPDINNIVMHNKEGEEIIYVIANSNYGD